MMIYLLLLHSNGVKYIVLPTKRSKLIKLL